MPKRQRLQDEAKAKVQENTQNIRGDGADYADHPQNSQQNPPPKPESIFSKKNSKISGNNLGGYMGRVMVGDPHRPTCIPAHSSKVVISKSLGSLGRGSFYG